jgi:hypothetical protein
MTKKILTLGNAFTPHRFYEYKYAGALTDKDVQSLKQQGWLEHELTPTEEARLPMAGPEGCCGDLLDKFYTMYGKEVSNA